MANPLSVLIIDGSEENQRLLQTILSFIGEECEHLNDLSQVKIEQRYKGVLLGEVPPSQALEIVKQHPQLPFVGVCESLEVDAANYLGRLRQPFSYDDLTRLLHKCQSYLSQIGELKEI